MNSHSKYLFLVGGLLLGWLDAVGQENWLYNGFINIKNGGLVSVYLDPSTSDTLFVNYETWESVSLSGVFDRTRRTLGHAEKQQLSALRPIC